MMLIINLLVPYLNFGSYKVELLKPLPIAPKRLMLIGMPYNSMRIVLKPLSVWSIIICSSIPSMMSFPLNPLRYPIFLHPLPMTPMYQI